MVPVKLHSYELMRLASLQHLAKLLCRSTGWVYGSDPLDVCRVAEKLAQQLSSQPYCLISYSGTFGPYCCLSWLQVRSQSGELSCMPATPPP